ncbi:MAG: DUF1365 domain-containing protein [Steroidobacteraceae bacterium]
MHSALYIGQLRHRRFAPRPHEFSYPLFMMYLDLAELDQVFRGRWLWSTRRPALAWLRRADYLGERSVSLDVAVREQVRAATGVLPAGPIRMLTHLRYLGIGFNPVTFYYCFDRGATRVNAIVAEITNTPWNERHAYVLRNPVEQRGELQRFQLQKEFHVSPFMPMQLSYDWRFREPGERLTVHMQNFAGEAKLFDATLDLSRRPISGTTLRQALLSFPCMGARVVGAIYWQALRLWAKRIPFHPHPTGTIEHARNAER